MKSKSFIIGLCIAALFQTAVLGSMIRKHHIELTTGQEVVLQSLMRDPRDFFRGHYTRLRLAVETVTADKVSITPNLRYGTAYLTLEKASPFWLPKSLSNTKPGSGIFLAVRVRSFKIDKGNSTESGVTKTIKSARLDAGFKRYYAPKTRAQYLEKINRDSKLGIILSVQDNGAAKIKGVSVDGDLAYDESIF